MFEIYENGKTTGFTFRDRDVANAIARDMKRENGSRIEVRRI
ncbi:hypothetical protein [Pseudorhizobium marinum]|nr:hypothetical protein [Pseudorhizobium marinum]